MTIHFTPIPTPIVRVYQKGGPDANGQAPEHHISDGDGIPCRHCLKLIPKDAGYLVLAYRPFPALQPYAEPGPIFLCADACDAGGGENLPEVLNSPDFIVRGYSAADRIIYGTGGVIATDRIIGRAETLLAIRRWPMCMSDQRATTAIRCGLIATRGELGGALNALPPNWHPGPPQPSV